MMRVPRLSVDCARCELVSVCIWSIVPRVVVVVLFDTSRQSCAMMVVAVLIVVVVNVAVAHYAGIFLGDAIGCLFSLWHLFMA